MLVIFGHTKVHLTWIQFRKLSSRNGKENCILYCLRIATAPCFLHSTYIQWHLCSFYFKVHMFFIVTIRPSRNYIDVHRPDDGGSKHLWNVSKYLPDYTAQQPTTQSPSWHGCTCSWISETWFENNNGWYRQCALIRVLSITTQDYVRKA
jgi:hypothetical protein